MKTEEFVRGLGVEALTTMHALLEIADTPSEEGVTAGHVLADWLDEHAFPSTSLPSHLRAGRWPISANTSEHWAGQCSWTRTLLFWTTEEVERRRAAAAKLRNQSEEKQEEQEEEETHEEGD